MGTPNSNGRWDWGGGHVRWAWRREGHAAPPEFQRARLPEIPVELLFRIQGALGVLVKSMGGRHWARPWAQAVVGVLQC